MHSRRLAARFQKLPVWQQTWLVLLAALLASEGLVLIFYSIFFEERLLLDLLLTGAIVLVVGYPLARFLISQNMRLRVLSADLERMARSDHLTGLANRRTFFQEGSSALGKGRSGGAFLFVDVDHFKALNDTYGHAIGDAVLRHLGQAMANAVREGDIAARIGGEEFGIYLPKADRATAIDVAERLRRKAAEVGPKLGLGPGAVTLSIGIELSRKGEGLEALMARADQRLYEAKSAGRDRIAIASARAA